MSSDWSMLNKGCSQDDQRGCFQLCVVVAFYHLCTGFFATLAQAISSSLARIHFHKPSEHPRESEKGIAGRRGSWREAHGNYSWVLVIIGWTKMHVKKVIGAIDSLPRHKESCKGFVISSVKLKEGVIIEGEVNRQNLPRPWDLSVPQWTSWTLSGAPLQIFG